MLRAVIDHARARVAVVHLTVLRANIAAKALYSRFGFVSYGVENARCAIKGSITMTN